MTAPAADSSAQLSGEGLRPGVLKVRHAVITSLAVITPAAAILFLPIPIDRYGHCNFTAADVLTAFGALTLIP